MSDFNLAINLLAKCILFVNFVNIFEKCLLFRLGDLDDYIAGLITVLLFLCSSVSANFFISKFGLSIGINSSLRDCFNGDTSETSTLFLRGS